MFRCSLNILLKLIKFGSIKFFYDDNRLSGLWQTTDWHLVIINLEWVALVHWGPGVTRPGPLPQLQHRAGSEPSPSSRHKQLWTILVWNKAHNTTPAAWRQYTQKSDMQFAVSMQSIIIPSKRYSKLSLCHVEVSFRDLSSKCQMSH